MPAHSEDFPWPSHYGHFKFFENQMKEHHCVSNLSAINHCVYELTLTSRKILRVFICECYSFGAAEYVETAEALGRIDAIIINSAWCGYTHEAKRLCRDKKVGLFKIGDFMAALNKPEFWSYLDKRETEIFKEKGWL
jgi:hypothetical protein